MDSEPGAPWEKFAAVDLGSNSFHLLVARREGGLVRVLDRRKEMVRLAAGLDANRNLSVEKQDEAISALERLGDLLKGIPSSNVRAVGTNTLRAANNSQDFLERARQALGCPIEVIAGKEEARLVYLGVAHSVAPTEGNRLVVDIGGGSTECVIGTSFEARICHSLRMGCVTYTQGFFPEGRVQEATLRGAIFAASNEVSTLEREFLEAGFQVAIGSSGTIHAISECARAEGWTQGEITPEVLDRVRRRLIEAGRIDKLRLAGISERRREVLAGGIAVLSAIFERLHVERMIYSDGALRDGVLYDMIGRLGVEDVRDRTVATFQTRYRVSTAQAERVWRRLESFLDQVGTYWNLHDSYWRKMARWAAALHEVGLAINYPGHHKHGAYLIQHSSLAGFSLSDQALLAALVLCHRRKFRSEALIGIPGVPDKEPVRLAVLLRLAVMVERMRTEEPSHVVRISVDGRKIEVSVQAENHEYSLLAADMEREAGQLANAKFELGFQRVNGSEP